MANNNNGLAEALQWKNEALEVKIEALQIKVEALELKNDHLEQTQNNVLRELGVTFGAAQKTPVKKKERTSTASDGQVDQWHSRLHELVKDENFSRPTYKALTGVLRALYENDNVSGTILQDYINGTKVSNIRHTGLLKKLGLLTYVGSRRKGHYALTEKGRALVYDNAPA